MGNTASSEATNTSPDPTTEDPNSQSIPTANNGEYVWPENLYVETRDMAAASFLVYTFGYILDTARKVGLEGMQVDAEGHATKSTSTTRLERSFTPSEVKELIEKNKSILAEKYPKEFSDISLITQSLDVLQERVVKNSRLDRPLSLVEFDDKHQDKEMVYAVSKDDINKRITLCFRGTDNQLAYDTNWSSNLNIWKVSSPVPEVVKDKVSSDQIWFHGGFYSKLNARGFCRCEFYPD